MLQQNPSWRNANSLIRYPFVDNDPMLFSDGTSIPLPLIVDAIIVSRLGRNWKLKSVVVETSDLLFSFTNGTDTLTGVSAAAPYKDQVVNLVDDSGVPSGQIIIGLGADLLAFNPVSSSNVAADDSGFITPGAIFVYELEGVLGVKLQTGEVVTGDIALQAGSGIVVSVAGNLAAGTIQFNAVGQHPSCATLSSLPVPIRFISGNTGTAAPNAAGQISLEGTKVIRFEVVGSNSIHVKDITGKALFNK